MDKVNIILGITLVLYSALAFFMGYGLGDYNARKNQELAAGCSWNGNNLWECEE